MTLPSPGPTSTSLPSFASSRVFWSGGRKVIELFAVADASTRRLAASMTNTPERLRNAAWVARRRMKASRSVSNELALLGKVFGDEGDVAARHFGLFGDVGFRDALGAADDIAGALGEPGVETRG